MLMKDIAFGLTDGADVPPHSWGELPGCRQCRGAPIDHGGRCEALHRRPANGDTNRISQGSCGANCGLCPQRMGLRLTSSCV